MIKMVIVIKMEQRMRILSKEKKVETNIMIKMLNLILIEIILLFRVEILLHPIKEPKIHNKQISLIAKKIMMIRRPSLRLKNLNKRRNKLLVIRRAPKKKIQIKRKTVRVNKSVVSSLVKRKVRVHLVKLNKAHTL